MRIRIDGTIIEKTTNRRNYLYELQSMLLSRMSKETANWFHQDNKKVRLLTFTNLFIHGKGTPGSHVHFLFSREERLDRGDY